MDHQYHAHLSDHRVWHAAETLSRKMAYAISALEAKSGSGFEELSLGFQNDQIEFRNALRDLDDRLAEAELERDALWDDNDRLRREIESLRHQLDARGKKGGRRLYSFYQRIKPWVPTRIHTSLKKIYLRPRTRS